MLATAKLIVCEVVWVIVKQFSGVIIAESKVETRRPAVKSAKRTFMAREKSIPIFYVSRFERILIRKDLLR